MQDAASYAADLGPLIRAGQPCGVAGWPYIDAGDLAGAVRLAVESDLPGHEAFYIGHYREALAAFDHTRDGLGAARTLAYLAAAETELGSYTRRQSTCSSPLPVLREAKDEVREGRDAGGDRGPQPPPRPDLRRRAQRPDLRSATTARARNRV